MGPSGAGKTTLLDILGDRINTGISGEILVNRATKNSKIFKKISAYIMQEDKLQEYLTVEESMRVASDLKCHPSPKNCERVGEIIEQLGLMDERDTLTKNLSGTKITNFESGENDLHRWAEKATGDWARTC